MEYWLFGGWAVDFHAGSITRSHDDIDIAVWLDDHDRIARLLAAEGWKHAPEADEDGGTGYKRDAVRLELTFLVPGDGGEVYIPLRAGRVLWSDEPLSTDLAELSGVVCAHVCSGSLRSNAARRASATIQPKLRRIAQISRPSLNWARSSRRIDDVLRAREAHLVRRREGAAESRPGR